ncbi:MAG: toprim domain-containing protein [Anaerolineae bacterium]|nr:toprim domain-containing protein [Anaerolineae bacterium]
MGKIYLSLRGVSEEAQEAFRVGWVKGKGIAIPLHSAPQRVCGVKIRHLEGPTRYTSLKGSKEGAVAPWGMQGLPTLVVVEGALDAMVAFPEVKALGAEVIACRSVEVIERFARGASRVVVWMDEDEAGERFAQKILTHLGARAERVPRTGFKDPAELAHAAARGKAPSIREVLEPLIGRRMPAWVALWEALAREGEIEPPPVKVPEEEVRRAQRALQYLPRGIAAGRVRQMREQARALLAEISKERGEDGG